MEKLLIGIAGVVVGAVLALVRDLWSDHRSKKKKAEYIAVRVSFLLEKFFSGCIDVAGDDGELEGRDSQNCVRLTTKVPEIDFLSLDIEWQSLPFDLMYEILNFPSLVDDANEKISAEFYYVSFPPDYDEGIEERRIQYSSLGLAAKSLSKKIRSKYRIPQKEYGEWNPVEHLKSINERLVNRRNHHEELRRQEQKMHNE